MSSQFQTYLTGYMEEVNKRISEDVRKMMSEYRSENNVKSIDLLLVIRCKEFYLDVV